MSKDGRRVEMRVSTLPTVHGEKAVMRVLDNATGLASLDSLGFTAENMERWKSAATRPQGLILVTGPTGSGKALAISTPILCKHGWSTMGDITVGDTVFGRDGQPCTVTAVSPIDPTPTLYRVTFSDGQTLDADADHQWLVSTHHSRSVPRTKKRQAAIARHTAEHQRADDLDLLAATLPDPDRGVTIHELLALLTEHHLAGEWTGIDGLRQALHMVDCPSFDAVRTRHVTAPVTRTERARFYRAADVLAAITSSGSSRRIGAQALLDAGDFPVEVTARQVADILGDPGRGRFVSESAARVHLPFETRTLERSYLIDEDRALPVLEYPLAVALKSLAVRIREQYFHAPTAEAIMERLTTFDLLDRGLRLGKNQYANFAVPVPDALDLPATDLPIDRTCSVPGWEMGPRTAARSPRTPAPTT